MSAHTPIIPPGSPLQRVRPDRNAKLVIAVFTILAVHVLLLSGLLIQGCKREDKGASAGQDLSSNSTMAAAPANTLPPIEENKPVAAPEPAPPQPSAPALPQAPSPNPAPVVVSEPAPSSFSQPPPASLPPARGELAVKPAQPAYSSDTPLVPYTVKRGDTLTRIAKDHATTIRAIREANGLKTERILVGQKLKVPQGSAKSAAPSSVEAKPQ